MEDRELVGFQTFDRKCFWENTGSEEAGGGGVLLRPQGGYEGARQESQVRRGKGPGVLQEGGHGAISGAVSRLGMASSHHNTWRFALR